MLTPAATIPLNLRDRQKKRSGTLEDMKISRLRKPPGKYAQETNGIGASNRKRGRPSTGFDKTAYMKEYMRKKRAEKKQHEKRA